MMVSGTHPLNLEQMHVRMDLPVFQSLLMLLERGAANYELWAEAKWGCA